MIDATHATRIRPMHRIALSILGCSLATLLAAGCTTRISTRPKQTVESELLLHSPNFETTVVHAVGRARCHYLFWIPLCSRQDLASAAWGEMRKNADIGGAAAQYVNVTEDQVRRWNILTLFYEEIFTVSADVLTFR